MNKYKQRSHEQQSRAVNNSTFIRITITQDAPISDFEWKTKFNHFDTSHTVSIKSSLTGSKVIQLLVTCLWPYKHKHKRTPQLGAGMAQWLECCTRDQKVAGLNPCRSSGIILFSVVSFLCWFLFRYLFHPCITTIAHKRPRSFCQKCRW